jgi:hypothetical protein
MSIESVTEEDFVVLYDSVISELERRYKDLTQVESRKLKTVVETIVAIYASGNAPSLADKKHINAQLKNISAFTTQSTTRTFWSVVNMVIERLIKIAWAL